MYHNLGTLVANIPSSFPSPATYFISLLRYAYVIVLRLEIDSPGLQTLQHNPTKAQLKPVLPKTQCFDVLPKLPVVRPPGGSRGPAPPSEVSARVLGFAGLPGLIFSRIIPTKFKVSDPAYQGLNPTRTNLKRKGAGGGGFLALYCGHSPIQEGSTI